MHWAGGGEHTSLLVINYISIYGAFPILSSDSLNHHPDFRSSAGTLSFVVYRMLWLNFLKNQWPPSLKKAKVLYLYYNF